MAKKKKTTQQQQMSPERYLREKVRQLPIYKCYRGENPNNSREMAIVVVRQHKSGNFTLASYLLDRWCLGVKDALWMFNISEWDMDDFLDHNRRAMQVFEEVNYVEAHNWVYGAVDWATNAGIDPCKDFALARYLLEEDDDNIELIEYEFGHNGEYCLEAKDQQEANKYIPQLRKTLGEGNFKVIISPVFEEDDEEECDDEYEDVDEDFDDSPFTMANLQKALKGLKKMSEHMADMPDMEYTYKGIDYPQNISLHYPQIKDIISNKNTENITDQEIQQILALDHNNLREDLHHLILWEVGNQWGKTKDDYNKDEDISNWNTIFNAMMFLVEVGNADSVPVVLETLRQSDEFLDFNFGDIMDYVVDPIIFVNCKDNPKLFKPFLLEEGLTTHAKNHVFGILTTIGLRIPQQRENIIKMTVEVLECYKENLPLHTICDGGCAAFGIDVLVSLGATEYLPLIEGLYETGMVDEYVVGPIESVRKEIRNPRILDRNLYLTPYEVRNAVKSFVKHN